MKVISIFRDNFMKSHNVVSRENDFPAIIAQ
jgi:hypothetical protein